MEKNKVHFGETLVRILSYFKSNEKWSFLMLFFVITSCNNNEDPCKFTRAYEKESWSDIVTKLEIVENQISTIKIYTNKRVIIQTPRGLLSGDLKIKDSIVKSPNSFFVTVFREGIKFASYDFADGNCDEYDKKPQRNGIDTRTFYNEKDTSKPIDFGEKYRENHSAEPNKN